MTKADDSTLSPDQLAAVQRQAGRALLEAGALGVFPTPVAQVMASAKVTVASVDVLDDGFLERLRKKAGGVSSALKRALSKVWGVLDAKERLAYISQAAGAVKQTFLKLHETAHAFLPWQRNLYVVVEDCEKTLDPEISDLFDREANVFASEVLFQLDAFEKEAADFEFGLRTPIRLSKKYGSSLYSAIRRYVSTHCRCCAVLVLNPPELIDGDGFVATVRRLVASPEFTRRFGGIKWPEDVTPDSPWAKLIPFGKQRMSRPREIVLTDANGDQHECIAEGFTQKHQVFILIHPVRMLTRTTVVVPSLEP